MRFDSRAELELRNAQQQNTPDAEWGIALLAAQLPLDVAAAAWRGMGRGLAQAGYEAYFREESGFRVIYARRKPDPQAEGGADRS